MIGDYYYDDIDDKEEAIRYYKRAAELGVETAAENLSRVLQKSEEPKEETTAPAVETYPFSAATEDLTDNLPF